MIVDAELKVRSRQLRGLLIGQRLVTSVTVQIVVFWVMTPCSPVGVY
jgi:hypothetical protein